jgi:hypothetical protein
MPMCWCPEQVVYGRSRQLIARYQGKHLPGCDSPSVPFHEAECMCAGPERSILLEAWAEDAAKNEYQVSALAAQHSIIS